MSEILEETKVEEILEAVAEQTRETPPASRPRREKVPLTCRAWAKVTAFILAIVMALVCAAGVLAAMVMANEEVYTIPEDQYLDTAMKNLALSDGFNVAETVLMGENAEGAREYLRYRNVARAEITFDDTYGVQWTYADGEMKASADRVYKRDFKQWQGRSGGSFLTYWNAASEEITLVRSGVVTIWLADEFTVQDDYFVAQALASAMYCFRYSVYGIIAAAAVAAVACFVFLLCASGRHPDHEGVRPGWGTKIPVDVLTAAAAIAAACVCVMMEEATWSDNVTIIVVWSLGIIALMTMVLGWCMSFALRIKLGGWWKNSLCWWCLRGCWACCRWCWKLTRTCCRGIAALVKGVPTVWKVVVPFGLLTVVELCFMIVCWDVEWILLWWGLEKCFLCPAVIALALMLRRLEAGGKALARGDLDYQVDTRWMLPVLRRHGENLNCIGEGMTRAVEERTRSERMKTELITNVSHDIKTPLTSIINYADLIGKEPCENETITGYAEVLHRQSERLKRLIDDLVEASKASTGNLEVVLSPCELGVMLTQTAGEYEQKLAQRQLTLVTRQPEQPVRILADGRRLWRVFDNLMNNVYKYGQSGTRVYLTLEEQEGQAVISLKNTSREPLDLSPDELMERFVRGDASRRSEGSGLGLSIARSLTQLQNGVIDVTVDGDLFKVVLKFPVLK